MPIISGAGGGGSGTISGVSVTGTAAAGQVPVASSAVAGAWAYPPGFEIGYDQITSTVNIVNTTEGTATTIITATAYTFDGGPVIATFYTTAILLPSTANGNVTVLLNEGATVLAHLGYAQAGSAAASFEYPHMSAFRFTPTAGSHTYSVRAFANVTTGTPNISAGVGGSGANAPAWLRFVKV